MRHMSGAVWAVFEKPVRMYRGNTMAGCIKDERFHRHGSGIRRRLLHAGPDTLALSFFASRLAKQPRFPGWGPEYARTMEAYDVRGRHVALWGKTCRGKPTV